MDQMGEIFFKMGEKGGNFLNNTIIEKKTQVKLYQVIIITFEM